MSYAAQLALGRLRGLPLELRGLLAIYCDLAQEERYYEVVPEKGWAQDRPSFVTDENGNKRVQHHASRHHVRRGRP